MADFEFGGTPPVKIESGVLTEMDGTEQFPVEMIPEDNLLIASTQISDSTTAGRSVLTAEDAAAQRTALGLGTVATKNTGTSADEVVLRGTSGTIPAAAGIYIGGSASANLLSAFAGRENWTPVLSFDGDTTGFTFNVQFGRVTKIGPIVLCFYQVSWTTKGTAAGTLRIQNLPYAISGTTWGYNPHMTLHHGDGFTGLKSCFSGSITNNNTFVSLFHKNSGENFAGITTGNLPSSGNLSGIVVYDTTA